MKRVGLWAAMGIGICITVGLLTVNQGCAEEKEHEPTCSLKTLKGRYLFGVVTTLVPPVLGVTEPSPNSAAGYHIYNGDGTGTDVVTVRINGETVLENFVTPTSYTINPDCTGTVIVTNGPSFGLFTAPGGEEVVLIDTTPGATGVLGPSRRVSRK
jgi:hypothetical protein